MQGGPSTHSPFSSPLEITLFASPFGQLIRTMLLESLYGGMFAWPSWKSVIRPIYSPRTLPSGVTWHGMAHSASALLCFVQSPFEQALNEHCEVPSPSPQTRAWHRSSGSVFFLDLGIAFDLLLDLVFPPTFMSRLAVARYSWMVVSSPSTLPCTSNTFLDISWAWPESCEWKSCWICSDVVIWLDTPKNWVVCFNQIFM